MFSTIEVCFNTKGYRSIHRSLEKSIELIQAKRIADANRIIKLFPENPEIQILNGRFGPYIKAGKKNVKIPKDREPASLTLDECVTLAANAPEKKRKIWNEEEGRVF
jgi:DNA topoisomerase-1